MNWTKVAKMCLAMGFVYTWVSLAVVSTAFVASLPLIPIIGVLFDVVIAPIWIALGIIAVPVSLIVSLKLLAWIDEGLGEFKIKWNLRGKFIRARNSLEKGLPRIVKGIVNLLT